VSAFGGDEVSRISKRNYNWLGGQATTIADSVFIMFTMNLSKDYQQARDFMGCYNLYQGSTVSFFRNPNLCPCGTTVRE
jgi:hypothetical protein